MKEMVYSSKREKTILYEGLYENRKFAIISLGTHPVAYVETTSNEPNDYNDEYYNSVRVHGGLTFGDKPYWNDNDKTFYVGWDYAHYMDYAGYEMDFPEDLRTDGKRWTTEEIFEDVKSVICQLNKSGGNQ